MDSSASPILANLILMGTEPSKGKLSRLKAGLLYCVFPLLLYSLVMRVFASAVSILRGVRGGGGSITIACSVT